MSQITIKEAQKIVDDWIKNIGIRYFSELTQLAQLTEEVGELARIISRTYGDQSFKKSDERELSDELADVLFVLICLANQTGVDLTQAFQKNMDKKTQRDKTRHKNNLKIIWFLNKIKNKYLIKYIRVWESESRHATVYADEV